MRFWALVFISTALAAQALGSEPQDAEKLKAESSTLFDATAPQTTATRPSAETPNAPAIGSRAFLAQSPANAPGAPKPPIPFHWESKYEEKGSVLGWIIGSVGPYIAGLLYFPHHLNQSISHGNSISPILLHPFILFFLALGLVFAASIFGFSFGIRAGSMVGRALGKRKDGQEKRAYNEALLAYQRKNNRRKWSRALSEPTATIDEYPDTESADDRFKL